MKMATHGFDRNVTANQVAAGAYLGKITTHGFDKPCGCLQLAASPFFRQKCSPLDLTILVATDQLVSGALFSQRKWQPIDLTSPVDVFILPQARFFGEHGHTWI